MIIDDSFVLGAGLYGLENRQHFRDLSLSGEELVMRYGGIEFEYVHRAHRLTHFSFSVLMGGGAVWDDSSEKDPFLLLEPGINALLNLTQRLRVGVGASYRLAGPVQLRGPGNPGISGPSGGITFKFGRF